MRKKRKRFKNVSKLLVITGMMTGALAGAKLLDEPVYGVEDAIVWESDYLLDDRIQEEEQAPFSENWGIGEEDSLYQSVEEDAKDLPESFDARTSGTITKVKDQSPYGSCWAFSVISAMETGSIINGQVTKEEADYSELALLYMAYHDMAIQGTQGDSVSFINTNKTAYLNCGGNYQIATNVMNQWLSPCKESTAPYDTAKDSNPDGKIIMEDTQAYLENVYWLTMTNPNEIKRHIMEFGCVSTACYYSTNYESEDGNSYYCPTSQNANHSITIIGWDDHYSAANFKSNPGGDGAWLVKNSWGTQKGTMEGFVYISYYDKQIQRWNAASFEVSAEEHHDNNYQMDGGIINRFVNIADSPYACMANRFTSDSYEVLKAVSLYTAEEETIYRVLVYTDVQNSTEFTREHLAYQGEWETPVTCGFHMYRLNQEVSLYPGENYAIVIELYNESENPSLTVEGETVNSYFETKVFADVHTSYVGETIDNMTDITEYTDSTQRNYGNVRIKAYTDEDASFHGVIINGVSQTGSNKITLTFENVRGAKGYRLYRKGPGDKSFQYIRTVAADKLSVTDTVPITNQTYIYKIGTMFLVGDTIYRKDYSKELPVCVNGSDITKHKINVSRVTPLGSNIEIMWETDPLADGYVIYRSIGSLASFMTYKVVNGNVRTGFTDESVVPGTQYYYYVRGFRRTEGANKYTKKSEVYDAKAVIPAVSEAKFLKEKDKGILTWSEVVGVKGYMIAWRKREDTKYTTLANVKGTSFSTCDMKLLNCAEEYVIRIVPYKVVDGIVYGGKSFFVESVDKQCVS